MHGCGVVKAIGRARDWAEANGLGAGVRRALPLVGAGIATVGVAVVCQSLAAHPVFADEAPQQGLVGQVTSSVLPSASTAAPSSSTASGGNLLDGLGLSSSAPAPGAPSGAPTVTGVVNSLTTALQPATGGSSSGVLGLGGATAESGSQGDVLGGLLGGVSALVSTPTPGQPGPVVTGSAAPAPTPSGPAIYNSTFSSARALAGATSDVPQGPPTTGVSTTPSAPVAPLRIPQPGSPVAPTGGSLGALQTFGPGATVATFDVAPLVESRAPRRPQSGLRSWQSDAVLAIIERPG